MVADECVEIRSERGVVDSEEQRLASWLEAGQDAPERLGVVWTPVKNEKADSFVEPLLPRTKSLLSLCDSPQQWLSDESSSQD